MTNNIRFATMKRVLISWIADKADFNSNPLSVNSFGPTFSFHQHFFKGYDTHILLSTDSPSEESVAIPKILLLFTELKKTFSQHNIRLEYLNISGRDVVDFNTIHAKVYSLLLEFKNEVVDIFVSPGTPAMQVVWYFIHHESNIKTRLFQILKPEHSEKDIPELIEIEIEKSDNIGFLLAKEKNLHLKTTYNYCITQSLIPVYEMAKSVALTDKTTVLIYGETGTGKEHLAKEIHKYSARRENPFIAINCAAFGDSLLESRLFGYEKGAFTGALKTTSGFFQAAEGGTIFLDEIGDISAYMQSVLLRTLQEGEIQKVGGNKSEKINVRVIAATNKNLYDECKKGAFRWDLYYRLTVAELIVPPLRKREQEEIEKLIAFFNTKFQKKLAVNKKQIKFAKETMKILCIHTWPGNVRELENLIESFYAFGKETIEIGDIPRRILNPDTDDSLKLNDIIHKHINKVVHLCNGNISRAKELLDVGSVNTVKKYLKNG